MLGGGGAECEHECNLHIKRCLHLGESMCMLCDTL